MPTHQSESADNVIIELEESPVNMFTVRLVIFVGLIFRGLGSSDNFVGLYFRGVPPLIT